MTVPDVIVLSSSPVPSAIRITARPAQSASMSSSPGLPSPSVLMKTDNLSSKGGQCTAQLTSKSIAGFATVTSLEVGSSGLDLDTRNGDEGTSGVCPHVLDSLAVDSEKAMKPNPKKRATAGAKRPISPTKSKSPSKVKDKLTDAAGRLGTGQICEDSILSVTEKKPRKARVKKDKVEGQPKIKKGKITKPGTEAGEEKAPIKRKRSTVMTGTVIPVKSTRDPDVVELPPAEQNLGLDKAVMRRKCWTPPKETGQLVERACERTRSTVRSVESAPVTSVEPSSNSIGTLFSSFGFAQESERRVVPQAARDCGGVVLSKRRKIELQNVVVQPRTTTTVPKRSRSPKKKPVTITEKATAQYMVKDQNPTVPLLQYFVSGDPAGTGSFQVTENDAVKPKKPTKPAKATSAKRKPKHGTAALPLLLSPESALKRVHNQDILFGTSSQLAEEESPTFLRELQQALKVSELASNQDPFVDSAYGGETPTKPKATKNMKGARVSSGRLWASAARDSEGNLMDAEIVNLADSPLANNDSESIKAIGEGETMARTLSTESPKDNAWIVLDGTTTAEACMKDRREEQSREQEPTHSNDEYIMPSHPEDMSLEECTRRKSPAKKTKKTKSKTTMVQLSQSIQKPDYVGYPTARLATELASYGFKPIKNRDQMIATLEKCWEGKNRVALQSITTNANPLNSGLSQTKGVAEAENGVEQRRAKAQSTSKGGKPSSAEPLRPAEPARAAEPIPKKPRGRPRKTTATQPTAGATQQPKESQTTIPAPSPKTKKPTTAKRKTTSATTVEEISDSDTPLTPSPPRRRSSHSSPTTPRALDLRPASAAEPTPSLSPAAAQTQLFANITKAITTFPRSTDQRYPTWHEKILMYDPIVLEDLAYWLNTEGLGRVGVDEEVGPALVKAWCEGRSVCCLWRENLRGGGRARR